MTPYHTTRLRRGYVVTFNSVDYLDPTRWIFLALSTSMGVKWALSVNKTNHLGVEKHETSGKSPTGYPLPQDVGLVRVHFLCVKRLDGRKCFGYQCVIFAVSCHCFPRRSCWHLKFSVAVWARSSLLADIGEYSWTYFDWGIRRNDVYAYKTFLTELLLQLNLATLSSGPAKFCILEYWKRELSKIVRSVYKNIYWMVCSNCEPDIFS